MTTRERFLKCMNFEQVDRPPNFELGYWGHTIERWLNEGMPREEEKAAESGFYGHKFFGIDERLYIPLNLGVIPPFEVKVFEENSRYILYRGENGILRRALKEGTVRGTRPSMDTYIEFPVKNREDFEELKKRYDPHAPGRYPPNWDKFVEQYRERDAPLCLVPNGAIGFYSLLRQWMGTIGVSKAFFRSPDLIHEMLDFIVDFIKEVTHKALHDISVDYFNFFEDFACKGGPLLSPRLFKEFMLPRYEEVIDFLHKHGVRIIWFDSDGNFEPLIPLIIEAGVNCIWPLEVASGMDPRKLRREYGHELVLSGGIDKREIAKGKEAIEREVMSKIPELVADGGYIPTIDHSVPPDISYENFLYYLKVKLEAMTQG